MAAISAIRKHGVLLMVIIGIALLAFLLGDLTNLTSYFSNSNTLAKIDGKKIDDQYRTYFEQNTALWKIYYNKSSLEESEVAQVHDMTWRQIEEEVLIGKQAEALGLIYTQEMIDNVIEEMLGSLRTQQPNPLLARMFETLAQQFGQENALQLITNIEEYRYEDGAKELYNAYKAIERMTVADKKLQAYYGLAQGSIYFSDELAKKLAADNQGASVEFASFNPNLPLFKDVAVTVTDSEIKEWYNKHKKRYTVTQDSRDIDVAIFPINPSPEDLKNIEDSVNASYKRFIESPSIIAYHINEMHPPVDSTYHSRADITLDKLDSLIFDRPVGTLIEPFNSNGSAWFFGKTFGAAHRPDSIQLAWVVVDFKTEQNASSPRTQEAAKKEADSIHAIIKADPQAIFALTPNYLGGRQATDSLMWVEERGTIPALYDTLVSLPNNATYFHELPGAYVIYQPVFRTAPIEKRQFVIYPFEIKASDITIKNIKATATQLLSESTSADKLNETASKKGIQIIKGVNVTSMASSISQQLPNCRSIVTWAYNKETKKDNISDVINIENRLFAVAALRNIKVKGTPALEDVKADIERELRDKKKIEAIEQKLKEELAKGTSLADVALKYGATANDSINLVFTGESYQNSNIENGVIGKIFTLPADNKPKVVSGKQNVYVVTVRSFEKAPPASKDLAFEKMTLRNIAVGKRNEMVIMEELKDKADVLDQRHLFYVEFR